MSYCIELERRYCAHNYEPLPVVLTRAEGVYAWDEHGERYLDMMSAYSAVSLGHAHPRLLNALQEQAKRLAVVSRAFYTDRLGPLAQRACELTGMDLALPMNSGAEAVETALKAARKWAYVVKGVPKNRAEIIVCRGNFHGRTIAIVGFSSEPQYRSGYGPFPPGFVLVPYGDAEALRRAVTPCTAPRSWSSRSRGRGASSRRQKAIWRVAPKSAARTMFCCCAMKCKRVSGAQVGCSRVSMSAFCPTV